MFIILGTLLTLGIVKNEKKEEFIISAIERS